MGGSTQGGSGTPRTVAGGAFYSGGARTPYTAGGISPLGITPFLLPVTALAFFSGAWLYGAYAYPYGAPYHYTHPIPNDTHANSNNTIPVVCLCQEFSECGCDNNSNSTYLNDVIGDPPRNSSNVSIVNVNGTETAYINGTLDNGTTASDPNAASAATSVMAMHISGYLVTSVLVSAGVWAL